MSNWNRYSNNDVPLYMLLWYIGIKRGMMRVKNIWVEVNADKSIITLKIRKRKHIIFCKQHICPATKQRLNMNVIYTDISHLSKGFWHTCQGTLSCQSFCFTGSAYVFRVPNYLFFTLRRVIVFKVIVNLSCFTVLIRTEYTLRFHLAGCFKS